MAKDLSDTAARAALVKDIGNGRDWMCFHWGAPEKIAK